MLRPLIQPFGPQPRVPAATHFNIQKETCIYTGISNLLVIILLRSASRKDVAVDAVLVLAVLERQLAEGSNHVLNSRVLVSAVLAAEVVEPGDLVEEVVHHGDDNGDTDRVSPDNNDGDNVDPAVGTEVVGGRWVGLVETAREPTEQTEDGSHDIDTEDGNDELERRPGLATTGNEDEPVLSEGDLEEENLLDGTEVLDDTTVGEEESATDDPGTESKQDTEDDGDEPDLGQLPLDRTSLRESVLRHVRRYSYMQNISRAYIVGNSDGGQIGEESDEDNELGTDGLVDDDHRGDEVKLKVETESNTVLDIRLHTLENLTGDLDGQDDGGETGGEENDIGSGLGSFGRTFDGNTAIGLLERGSIVDTYDNQYVQDMR